jgi:hypothetical protein
METGDDRGSVVWFSSSRRYLNFKDDDEEGGELVIEIFFRPPGSVWCSPVSYTCKFPWTWMQGERGRKKVEGSEAVPLYSGARATPGKQLAQVAAVDRRDRQNIYAVSRSLGSTIAIGGVDGVGLDRSPRAIRGRCTCFSLLCFFFADSCS